MHTPESTGLFLGAGASYELGMPLVSNLTGEFKGYFTPDHTRELNARWRSQGGGYDDSVIEATIALLVRDDLHYENILGYLQTVATRHDQTFARQYGGMYERMVELVYLLLYHRQVGSLPYIIEGFPPFEGLTEFAQQSSPLWVFSLNHDLILQLLAVHCAIPLRDAFWPTNNLTAYGNQPGAPKASVLADILTEDDLNRGNLCLFKPGESGINLLRLHGALDMFTFRDGLDLCRLRPETADLSGYLTALRRVNEDVGCWLHGTKMRVINELSYTDADGVEQFLRRTLLAGAQKFEKRYAQTLPQKMLDVFRSYVNYVQKLYVLGYSFGDAHIDLVLRNWMEFSGNRTMIIVKPSRTMIPAHFAHLAPQISVKQQTAGEFFAGYRSTPLTPAQQLQLELRKRLRPAFEEKAAEKW